MNDFLSDIFGTKEDSKKADEKFIDWITKPHTLNGVHTEYKEPVYVCPFKYKYGESATIKKKDQKEKE